MCATLNALSRDVTKLFPSPISHENQVPDERIENDFELLEIVTAISLIASRL